MALHCSPEAKLSCGTYMGRVGVHYDSREFDLLNGSLWGKTTLVVKLVYDTRGHMYTSLFWACAHVHNDINKSAFAVHMGLCGCTCAQHRSCMHYIFFTTPTKMNLYGQHSAASWQH